MKWIVGCLAVASVLFGEETSPFLKNEMTINEYSLSFEGAHEELVIQTTMEWDEDPEAVDGFGLKHCGGEKWCFISATDYAPEGGQEQTFLLGILGELSQMLFSKQTITEQKISVSNESNSPFLRSTFKVNDTLHVCLSLYVINHYLIASVMQNSRSSETLISDADFMIYNTFLRSKKK